MEGDASDTTGLGMERKSFHSGQARWAVSGFFFLNGFLFASWVSRIPLIQDNLHLSHGTLGLGLLAGAGGAVVTMPIAGLLISRVGSENLLKWLLVPYCVALPMLAVAPNFWALVVGLFFFGATHGGLDVAMNAQAVAVAERCRKPVMASFHAMFSIGGLAGAAMGALLAWGKIAPITHFVAMGMAMGLVGWWAGRRLLQGVDRVKSVASAEGRTFRLPPKSLIPLGIVAVIVLMGEGAMADWTGVYLHKILGSSEAIAAAGYAAFSISMAVGRLLGDRLSETFSDEGMVRASGWIAAAGLALALVSVSPWLSVLGFMMVGAGYSTVVPLVFGAAGRTPGVKTGVALASVTTMGYFGFLIGPPVIGFAAELMGLRGALALLIVTSLWVTWLAPTLNRPRV
jgi:predicted MFS family arabinose efflux permease